MGACGVPRTRATDVGTRTIGQSHASRPRSDPNLRRGVAKNLTTHAGTVPRHDDKTINDPVPVLLNAGDGHNDDRAATTDATAQSTVEAGDSNAGSETAHRSNGFRVDHGRRRSLGTPAVAGSDIDEECANEETGTDTYEKSELLTLDATPYSHHCSTAVLIAHALLLLGCACVLLLPVLLLLLPGLWGRWLGCPPRRRSRRTPSSSRCGPGSPHRRAKFTRRLYNPPFWMCALALLGRYFSFVGAAPLTDATFKLASWGK